MTEFLEERSLYCPYCGEIVTVNVEPLTEREEYVEDCPVCCRPNVVHVEIDDDGDVRV